MRHSHNDLRIRPGHHLRRDVAEQHFRARDVFAQLDILSSLVGPLVETDVGMLGCLQERAEPRPFDGNQFIESARLRAIGLYLRRHQRKSPRLSLERVLRCATRAVRIGLRCASIHHDRPALRAKRYPYIDAIVLPAIDDGADSTDIDSILSRIEIDKRVGGSIHFPNRIQNVPH